MASRNTNKPATKGGALSKSPSTPKVDPKATRAKNNDAYSSSVRNLSNLLVGSPEYDAAVNNINKLGKRLGYKPERISASINKWQQKGTPGAPPGSPEAAFRNMSPDQQAAEMGEDYGAYLNQAWAQEQARLGQPQPDFSNQLESARQNVMGQFERTMGPEFQRQQMELRQRMAEQGIDPNSGAYQAQMKMLNDSQSNARQNAMSQAFTQGAEYQQQGFTQDSTNRMMPFQIAQLGSEPWKLGFAARTEAQQKALDRQAQERMARSSGGAAVRAAQIQADATRDVAAMQGMNGYNQPKQPNFWNGLATGLGTGAGAAATNNLLK